MSQSNESAPRFPQWGESDVARLLKVVFDTANQGFWLIDNRTVTRDLNPRMAEILGESRERVVGRSIFDYVDDENAAIFREQVIRRETGVVGFYEIALSNRRRGKVPCLFHTTPLFDGQGEKIGAFAFVTDIEERKKIEESLKSSVTLLQTLVDTIPHPVFYKDARGHYLGLNRGFERLFGASRESLVGKTIYQLCSDTARADRLHVRDIELLAKGGQLAYEAVMPDATGALRTLFFNKATFNDAEGKIAGLVGVVEDITDRKEAETRLRESEARFKTLADATFEAIIVVEEGKVIDANDTAYRLIGNGRDDLVGADPLSLFAAEYREVVAQHIAADDRSPREAALIHGDGSLVAVEIRGRTIEKAGGEVRVVAIRDITERKEFDRRLTDENTKAEGAIRLKDKFVSLVAHDLKSPLATMTGLLEIILNDANAPLNDRSRRVLQAAVASGEHMVAVIDDLLDISRLTTGRLTPRPRFVDAHAVVEQVLTNLYFTAHQKGVSLVNAVPPGSRLYADPTLFGEVIKNLVSNAVKFSDAQTAVTLFIPDDPPCTVAVADQGRGISAEMRDDLFRPEVKTSDVGTAGERGTGLGLPYSREIMRAHRGDVTLHATGPAGSVFHATLPVVRPVVLVVDDERIARRVIAERLAVVDVEIVEAADGKEALERIAERTPHLIVSDYLMPGVDGFDLLRRVKRDPSTGTIPFIMTTSDTKMETRDTALRLGADDFVVKPFTPEDFLPRVKKYIV